MFEIDMNIISVSKRVQITSDWYKLKIRVWVHYPHRDEWREFSTHEFIHWAKKHPMYEAWVPEFVGGSYWGHVYVK